MPEIDGVAILEEFRKESKFNDIHVIMVSGISDEDVVAHCLEMGATDYIVKPLNSLVLGRRVALALNDSRYQHTLKKLEISEDELAWSQARYNAIIETSVDGIISVDFQGIVTMFNPAAKKMLGY